MTDSIITQDPAASVKRSNDEIHRDGAEGLKECSDTNKEALIIANCKEQEDNHHLSPTVHQQTQPLQHTLPTEFRRPLLKAKSRLNYHHDTWENSTLTSKLSSVVVEPAVVKSDYLTNDDSSDNGQHAQFGFDNVDPSIAISTTIPPSNSETDSVKLNGHIQSSTSSSKTIASTIPASPLTKSLKAFHKHQSLEMQRSYSPSATCTPPSTPVLIPSVSFPYLPTAHSISQPFTLESSPLYQVPQSPPSSSLVSLKEPTECSDSTPVNNSEQYSSNVQIVNGSSPSVGVTTSDNTTSTTTNICSNPSRKSELSSPASLQLRSLHRKSSGSSVGAIVKLHKHLSTSERNNVKSMTRNQQSQFKTAQLKQVLTQGSPKQQAQQKSQPSIRCPRKIHCNNCGHKIDLTNYLLNKKSRGGESGSSSGSSQQSRKSAPSKSNANNSGLTVFDLETICDTGNIDNKPQLATVGQTPLEKEYMIYGIKEFGYNSYNKGKSKTWQSSSYYVGQYDVTLPLFPHSDELTRSFAPIFSDAVYRSDRAYTLAEGWDKLDSLDVDEILELLETTSETMYCKGNDKARPVNGGGKQHHGSVLPATHIFTKSVNRAPYDEIVTGSVYGVKGSTYQERHYSKVKDIDGSTTNSSDDDQSIEHTSSDGNCLAHMANSSSRDDLSGYNLKDKTNLTELRSSKKVNIVASNTLVNSDGNSDSEGELPSQESTGRVLRSRMKQTRTSRICKKKPRKKNSKKTKGNEKQINPMQPDSSHERHTTLWLSSN